MSNKLKEMELEIMRKVVERDNIAIEINSTTDENRKKELEDKKNEIVKECEKKIVALNQYRAEHNNTEDSIFGVITGNIPVEKNIPYDIELDDTDESTDPENFTEDTEDEDEWPQTNKEDNIEENNHDNTKTEPIDGDGEEETIERSEDEEQLDEHVLDSEITTQEHVSQEISVSDVTTSIIEGKADMIQNEAKNYVTNKVSDNVLVSHDSTGKIIIRETLEDNNILTIQRLQNLGTSTNGLADLNIEDVVFEGNDEDNHFTPKFIEITEHRGASRMWVRLYDDGLLEINTNGTNIAKGMPTGVDTENYTLIYTNIPANGMNINLPIVFDD